MSKQQKTSFWKILRVGILLIILATVAINAWRDQNQDWSQPIFITLYPINADRSNTSAHYIQQLQSTNFIKDADYLSQQAAIYQHQPLQVYIRVAQPIEQMPPAVPTQGSVLDVMLWSLKFRYYAWQQRQDLGYTPSVELFLNYYDVQTHSVLRHSTALEKGRIGIVNLFSSAKQEDQNAIVVTHEILHAFGATDKYQLHTGQPIYPIGYAEPYRIPLYPQHKAEIMAVAVPTSETQSKMAANLSQTLVSQLTAQEVGWLKPVK